MKPFLKLSASIILIILLVGSGKQALAQSPNFKWARGMGGPGYETGYAVAVDKSGNVYSAGVFQGVVDFDPGPAAFTISAQGLADVFVTKLDSSGNFIWARRMGGPSEDYAHALALDTLGNVYTTGRYKGTGDFDPGSGTFTMSSVDSFDVFVSKLDANGNFAWAKSMGGASFDAGYAIAVDVYGNVYAAGSFYSIVDFDPGSSTYSLSSNGLDDIFISKLDANGNFVWAKNIGSTWVDRAYSITTDVTGNVYATGNFYYNPDFDPGPGTSVLNASIGWDIFILKLDASGNFVWAKSIDQGNSNGADESIAVDALGNVYATGCFAGNIDFDPGPGTYTMASASAQGQFVVKLNASGNFVWARNMGSTLFIADNNAVGIDAAGNVYFTASFYGTSDLNPSAGIYTVTPTAFNDIFLTKLDASGNFLWAKTIGGTSGEGPKAITLDPKGNVYATGYFHGISDFDPGAGVTNLSSSGSGDIFVLKLGDCSQPPAPLDITPPNNKFICANSAAQLYVSGYGTMYWYTSGTATQALASGMAFVTPTLSIGTATFYAGARTCANSASRTAITVTVDACLGVENQPWSAGALINVYPNPFHASAVIELNHLVTNLELSIYDSSGRKVKVINAAETTRLNMERGSLSAGLYYYEARQNLKQLFAGKFVILD